MVLVILIPLGMLLGQQGPVLEFLDAWIDTRLYVFAVLFCMSVTLKLSQVRETALRPGGVVLAVAINSGLLPLFAWGLISIFSGSPLAAGLMIVAVVPSTMASAAVWTRRANGNDAIPLLVTLITNGSCFLVIPFWLWLTLGTRVPIDAQALVYRLFLVAVLPMALGQLVRLLPWVRSAADRWKPQIGVVAQAGILVIVAVGSIRTGPVLASSAAGLSVVGLGLVVLACLFLHGVGLLVGWRGMRIWNQSTADAIGVMFAGSQKTLPIAVDLATSPLLLSEGMSPLAILPPLIFHALQLVTDTIVLERVKISTSDN